MGPDWSDGDYSRTAVRLEPVAKRVVQQLGIDVGQRVLDVGCGTGNAALAAARAGAVVTAVDPAAGLLALAQRRADEERLEVAFRRRDAQRLCVAADFDVVVSVFGVIFADDASQAMRGMLRAARSHGTVALTTWRREGALSAVADVLFAALPPQDGPQTHWDDPQWIENLLIQEGASQVTIDDDAHVFRADSPEALFAETEEHHPVWRWARRLMTPNRWDLLRRDSVAALHAGNEDTAGFATTSPYLFVRATR